MPTQKPIISVVLDEETLKQVDDFRFENRIASRSKALNEIIRKGMARIQKEESEGEK